MKLKLDVKSLKYLHILSTFQCQNQWVGIFKSICGIHEYINHNIWIHTSGKLITCSILDDGLQMPIQWISISCYVYNCKSISFSNIICMLDTVDIKNHDFCDWWIKWFFLASFQKYSYIDNIEKLLAKCII